jgi:hypothetical protein
MRRRIVVALFIAVLLSVVLPSTALADHDEGPWEVYFPQTGHVLKSGFLGHWRHHGEIALLGYPLTDEFVHPRTGVVTQYFERAVMEWHSDQQPPWQVTLQRLGADLTKRRSGERPFRPVAESTRADCTWFRQTRHFSCMGFRAFWERYGGLPAFGYPISEEHTENGMTVQYYERARFEWHPEHKGTIWEVQLGRLGVDAARRARVSTTPTPQPAGVAAYDPGLWKAPPPPELPPPVTGAAPPGAPSWAARWVEVDLSAQYLTAWEYSSTVFGTYVSTGLPGYETPTGTFSVFAKLSTDDMTSGPFVDPSEYYYVEDVPWVMYFAGGGYAIHGVYWHSSFGSPHSHGCVGAPVWAAEWLFSWAPYGTVVWVHG